MNTQEVQVDEDLKGIAEMLLGKAKDALVKNGWINPYIFLGTADGKIHTCILEFDDDKSKLAAFLRVSKLAREIHALTAFLVSDGWMKTEPALPNETLQQMQDRVNERGIRIRDLPDRCEALIVTVTGPGVKGFSLSVEHWEEGGIVRFGEPILYDGQMIYLLPPWWD